MASVSRLASSVSANVPLAKDEPSIVSVVPVAALALAVVMLTAPASPIIKYVSTALTSVTTGATPSAVMRKTSLVVVPPVMVSAAVRPVPVTAAVSTAAPVTITESLPVLMVTRSGLVNVALTAMVSSPVLPVTVAMPAAMAKGSKVTELVNAPRARVSTPVTFVNLTSVKVAASEIVRVSLPVLPAIVSLVVKLALRNNTPSSPAPRLRLSLPAPAVTLST